MTQARALLAEGAARLRAAGIDGAARDASLLLAHVLGIAPGALAIEPARAVAASEAARFSDLIEARAARCPVSRLLGRRAFWGRDFAVTPDVLDPRPETETLIAAALDHGPAERLADLGTGTGILAITLLAEWPEARAVASDLSQAALDVAARNAATHGVDGRMSCVVSDWFARIEGRFDLIVSNPPYIAQDEMAGLAPEVALHDPGLALTDRGDGLAAYRAIAAGAGAHLVPGGRLLVEIGPTQGAAVAGLFAAAGLEGVTIHPDFDGRDRIIGAFWPV